MARINEKQYLTCTATAKLLRQVLKKAFPKTKFSVRSDTYSGGASIRIHWTDGPTRKQVENLVKKFEGAGFDGMTDYKSSREHTFQGQPVHFGADYIFTERDYSNELLQEALAKIAEVSNGSVTPKEIDLEELKGGKYNPVLQSGWYAGEFLWTAIYRVAEGVSLSNESTGISKEEPQSVPSDMLPQFVREY